MDPTSDSTMMAKKKSYIILSILNAAEAAVKPDAESL